MLDYKEEQTKYRGLTLTKLIEPGTQYNRKARRFKIDDPNFTKKRSKIRKGVRDEQINLSVKQRATTTFFR